jgi:hypothetical protein
MYITDNQPGSRRNVVSKLRVQKKPRLFSRGFSIISDQRLSGNSDLFSSDLVVSDYFNNVYT